MSLGTQTANRLSGLLAAPALLLYFSACCFGPGAPLPSLRDDAGGQLQKGHPRALGCVPHALRNVTGHRVCVLAARMCVLYGWSSVGYSNAVVSPIAVKILMLESKNPRKTSPSLAQDLPLL